MDLPAAHAAVLRPHQRARGADRPDGRTYPTLSAIEDDALNSRIWGGLHFRTAMDDGYAMAHRTAYAVLERLG